MDTESSKNHQKSPVQNHLFVLLEQTFSFANLILSGQDIDWRQKYLKPRVSHAIYKWLFLTDLVPGSRR